MARSKFLRGFDDDIACKIVDNMRVEGTNFLVGCIPVQIEKRDDGRLEVSYQTVKARHCSMKPKDEGYSSHEPLGAVSPTEPAEHVHTDVFDTVMLAIGREPNTPKLNLAAVGVETAPNGKIYHHNERITRDHIYVLGDVGEPCIELTPVAIKQGILLANRLYGGKSTLFDFKWFPTTVFTPLEYGCIGCSEEKAYEIFGEANIEVFHAEFTPLEHYLVHSKQKCYAKLVVNYLDHQRVVGFHYLGPNAGEVTQGFAGAMRAGLRKKDWDAVVGIHPTCAEEMVTLRWTKRSGLDPKKTGC